MKTVWKFPIPLEDFVTVEMPMRSKVLSVAEQNGQLCLWALVDPMQKKHPRSFRIAGTGHPIDTEDCGVSLVGTVITAGGALVWHVFEVVPF